jgi:hypothetical protein
MNILHPDTKISSFFWDLTGQSNTIERPEPLPRLQSPE